MTPDPKIERIYKILKELKSMIGTLQNNNIKARLDRDVCSEREYQDRYDTFKIETLNIENKAKELNQLMNSIG